MGLNAAVQNLQSRSCTSALVAGVNFIFVSATFYAYMSGNILAADGQCKTFDVSADGIGRGEACGAVMLQGSTAVTYLVDGTAVNQDGRSASMAAPNGPSQVELMHRTTPSQSPRCSVETHGTGTSLGDPIEAGALHAVFSQFSDCVYAGAPKSNVSHTEGAAGITSVLKALLTLQHRRAVPNLHMQQMNPKLDLDGFSVVMPTQLVAMLHQQASAQKQNWCARGSSFGMSGTNAHAVFSTTRAVPEALTFTRQQSVCYQHAPFPWWDVSDSLPTIASHIYAVKWQSVIEESDSATPSLCSVQVHDFGTDVTSEGDAKDLQQFTVCILGAGVTGIGIAGMLSLKGISNVMLDSKPHIGGLWHDGYHGLQLHSPTYYYQFIDLEVANDIANDPDVIEALLYTRRNAKEQIEYFEEYARLHHLKFVPGVQGEIVDSHMVQLTTTSKATSDLAFEWVIDARMAHINGGPTRVLPNAEPFANEHLAHPKSSSFVIVGSGKSGADAIIQLAEAGFTNLTWICAHKTGFARREDLHNPTDNAKRNEKLYHDWFNLPLDNDLGNSLDLVCPHDEIDCYKLGIVDSRELAILTETRKVYKRVEKVEVTAKGSTAYLDDGSSMQADVVISALGPNAHQTGALHLPVVLSLCVASVNLFCVLQSPRDHKFGKARHWV